MRNKVKQAYRTTEESISRKKSKYTKSTTEVKAENILKRDFNTSKPNVEVRRWRICQEKCVSKN